MGVLATNERTETDTEARIHVEGGIIHNNAVNSTMAAQILSQANIVQQSGPSLHPGMEAPRFTLFAGATLNATVNNDVNLRELAMLSFNVVHADANSITMWASVGYRRGAVPAWHTTGSGNMNTLNYGNSSIRTTITQDIATIRTALGAALFDSVTRTSGQSPRAEGFNAHAGSFFGTITNDRMWLPTFQETRNGGFWGFTHHHQRSIPTFTFSNVSYIQWLATRARSSVGDATFSHVAFIRGDGAEQWPPYHEHGTGARVDHTGIGRVLRPVVVLNRAALVTAAGAIASRNLTVQSTGNGTTWPTSGTTTTLMQWGGITLAAEPAPGHQFLRWELVSGVGTLNMAHTQNAIFGATTGDATIRAVFIDIQAGNMNAATFNLGDGRTYQHAFESGGPITRPWNPTRFGFAFAGWFTTAGGNTEFNFALNRTADVTIFAGWEPLTGNVVSLNFAGGLRSDETVWAFNPDRPQTLWLPAPGIMNQNPPSEGQTFLGWYDNPGFAGSPVYQIPSGATGPQSFYARWS